MGKASERNAVKVERRRIMDVLARQSFFTNSSEEKLPTTFAGLYLFEFFLPVGEIAFSSPLAGSLKKIFANLSFVFVLEPLISLLSSPLVLVFGGH